MGLKMIPAVAGFAAVALIAASLGCSRVHVSGYSNGDPDKIPDDPEDYEVGASTLAQRPRPEDYLPAKLTDRQKETLFYSDLGPDVIDVSQYPAQQKFNYAVYAHACSQCHTLARSINAPAVSRKFWNFYMLSMRWRNWHSRNPSFTKEERRAVLDFLDYDSHARKVSREKEFDALTRELKRRYNALMDQRMKRLSQDDQPKIIP